MLANQGYTTHPGMWIFGLTLFEILIGESSFRHMDAFKIFKSFCKWTPTFPSNLTDIEEIQQLIIRL
jgi:hypothetical protein